MANSASHLNPAGLWWMNDATLMLCFSLFQAMVTEVDQFNRGSQYQSGAYPSAVGENCFPNNTPEMIDISALQQREWEMRVYNQMHGNSTPTEAEYLFAARKVQV